MIRESFSWPGKFAFNKECQQPSIQVLLEEADIELRCNDHRREYLVKAVHDFQESALFDALNDASCWYHPDPQGGEKRPVAPFRLINEVAWAR